MTIIRKGYDSTSAVDCPDDGRVYGGYNDGTYSTDYDDLLRLHPKALVFSIGRFTHSRADFYDVENGLLDPDQGVALAKGNIARGEFAGLYCNESTWPKVQTALIHAHILDKVVIWLAWEQDNQDDTIPHYADGRQFLLSPGRSPGHYDVSNWRAYIPGLDPTRHPRPQTIPPHVRVAGIVVRRWAEKYARTPAGERRPLRATGLARLKRWVSAIQAAEKAAK